MKNKRQRDCIEHGQKNKHGYGNTTRHENGVRFRLGLHVAAYYDRYGFIPRVVMHTCDNPRCINPDHLVAGTHKANSQDMIAKGRQVKRGPQKKSRYIKIDGKWRKTHL